MSLAEDTCILTSLSIDTNKVPGNGNGNTNWGLKNILLGKKNGRMKSRERFRKFLC